jgi:signal transduction histidine kinase
MVVNDTQTSNWRDWTTFWLRWIVLAAAALAFIIIQGQPPTNLPVDVAVNQILLALVVGVIVNITYGVFIFFQPLNGIIPFVLIPGDWMMAGLLVYATKADPLLYIPIASGLMVAGLLRLGALWGGAQALGVFIASVAGIVAVIGADYVGVSLPKYITPLLTVILLGVVTGVWVYMQEEQSGGERQKTEKEIREKLAEVTEMEKRARVIAEMANTVGYTLSYEEVLDAALNIGDTLRKSPKERMLKSVLLFDATGEALYVATSRGLRPDDEHRSFKARSGLIGQALKERIPVIGKDPTNDAELVHVQAFAGMRSVLVIPLSARFDNYGVLIFGSDRSGAFNEESIETLKAIGTQVAIALHNAQLYTNLMEQRDRIVELEADGRKALARDLHDSPAQTIAAVKMRIEIIQRWLDRDPSKVPQELQEVKEMADLANQQIRHVLSSLYPLILETTGLLGALQQFPSSMMSKYNQRVEMKLVTELESCFSKPQQGEIYFLVTEAVQNACKYADAQLIRVTAGLQSDQMVVQIADNGKGFDVDTARKNEKGRYGLNNLYERAEKLDGLLNIESQVGRGTRITLIIPIRETRRDRPSSDKRRPATMASRPHRS